MMHAYAETYLQDAMNCLGEMLDYVENDCGLEKESFFSMFIVSGIADQFADGNPTYVAGMSGAELAFEVLRSCGRKIELPEPVGRASKTAAYWCGWILAYYQWDSGRSFRDILKVMPLSEIEKRYAPLHEAAEEKFSETVNEMIADYTVPAKLQSLRKNRGLSQRELAERSRVSLRSIQMYEQRQKDINKAQAGSLESIARILGCEIKDLLEYESIRV